MDHAALTACPADAVFADFVSGLLPSDAAEALEAHVDRCISCRAMLTVFARCGPEPSERTEGEPLPGGEDTVVAATVPITRDAQELVGATLAHFRIVAILGEGGMGVVYRAIDEKLRRTVALKVLPAALAGEEEGRRRLLQEARSAAAVSHPNIAAVYEVGEAHGRVFIAMELVRGTTLRQRLEQGSLRVSEAVRIARQIAVAVGKAHERGIVHRDLKPENVMIGADLEVKLLDFGLAKLRPIGPAPAAGAVEGGTELSRAGQIIGTPAYMSPEQAAGGEVDHRSDIFSLGVVLYEMVTGTRPFPGRTVAEIRDALARRELVPASTCNPDSPPILDAILASCLAASPADRHASTGDLLLELERLGPADRPAAHSAALQTLVDPTADVLIRVGVGEALCRLRERGGLSGIDTAVLVEACELLREDIALVRGAATECATVDPICASLLRDHVGLQMQLMSSLLVLRCGATRAAEAVRDLAEVLAMPDDAVSSTTASGLSTITTSRLLECEPWLRAIATYHQMRAGNSGEAGADRLDARAAKLLELLPRVGLLKRADFFADLTGSALAGVAEVAHEMTVPVGEKLLREGEAADSIYVLCDGRVGIFMGGREVWQAGPGNCLGETSLIDGEVEPLDAIVRSEVRALRVSRSDFETLISAHPWFARSLLRKLARRVRDLVEPYRQPGGPPTPYGSS